jgi:hypothetical protein
VIADWVDRRESKRERGRAAEEEGVERVGSARVDR